MNLSKRTAPLFIALIALATVPVAAADEARTSVPQVADVLPPGDCGSTAPVDLAALVEPTEAPTCSVDSPADAAEPLVAPVEQQGPPNTGYCACGCGITCETDADCGEGGSCVKFITCC